MKSLIPYPATPEVLNQLVEQANSSSDPGEVLRALRSASFDKIDCIKFLHEHYAITLGEAKDVVHLSPAWADRYQSDEAFHDAAEQSLNLITVDEQQPAA